MGNKSEISLVYMAAGISSRFGGKIKAFAKVGPQGETLIEYSINQALLAGFSKIFFIVGNTTIEPFKEMFSDNYKGVPIEYVLQSFDPIQRDRPWGTAQAISVLKGHVNGSFVVCNSDDIYGQDAFLVLYEHLKKNKGSAIVGYKLIDNLSEKGTSNRGIIDCDKNMEVKSIKEVLEIDPQNLAVKGLKPETMVSMNMFGFENEIIDEMWLLFEKFKSKHLGDRKIEMFLPTELSNMIAKGNLAMTVYPAAQKTIGLTYPEDEEIVRRLLSKS